MSELINKNDNRATIRWKLLTGASALALTAYVSTGSARAEDAGRPQVWVELGGGLSQLQDNQEIFIAPLMDVRPSYFEPSQNLEKPPRFMFEEAGKISFQPEDSPWIFSAAVQFGRTASDRHVIQQTHNSYPFTNKYGDPVSVIHYAVKFADTETHTSERHAVIDFQAGRDVGIGLFGQDATSSVSLGVRFAQFDSKTSDSFKSDPDWAIGTAYKYYVFKFATQNYHSNVASFSAQREFRGVGPSLSWNSSVPIAGNEQEGELGVDWGINAALLFGKQRAHTHHQSTGRYHNWKYAHGSRPITHQAPATPDHTRSRNVSVPNVGGFAGISYSYSNAKISLGYKADFFFNAIDGGIDARKNENRGFFGPYASISIGLGD